jgi:hypothetical protein
VREKISQSTKTRVSAERMQPLIRETGKTLDVNAYNGVV